MLVTERKKKREKKKNHYFFKMVNSYLFTVYFSSFQTWALWCSTKAGILN